MLLKVISLKVPLVRPLVPIRFTRVVPLSVSVLVTEITVAAGLAKPLKLKVFVVGPAAFPSVRLSKFKVAFGAVIRTSRLPLSFTVRGPEPFQTVLKARVPALTRVLPL